MAANKCNIILTAFAKLKELIWGVHCKQSSVDDSILENYAEYLDCSEVNLEICYPSSCTDIPTILNCAGFTVNSIGLVIEQPFYHFSVSQANFTGGNPPFSCVWEYNPILYNLVTDNGCEIVLTLQVGANLGTLSTITVTVTDYTGCVKAKTCFFLNGEIHCEEDYELCPPNIILTVGNYNPIDANLIFSWDRITGDPMSLLGRINGGFSLIDWGDGTINSLLSHTYATTGNFTVTIYNSDTTILYLGSKIGPSPYKLTSVTAWPVTLIDTQLGKNLITYIPSLLPLVDLKKLYVFNNQLTGVFDISTLALIEELYISENTFSGVLDLTGNTALTMCIADDNNFTDVIGISSPGFWIQCGNNNLPEATINYILVTLDTGGLLNSVCSIIGQTPAAAPTGAGIAAKNSLLLKGWTVNTD